MASLALMAGFIFLFVLLIGPTVYVLSWIRIIPNFLIFILAVVSILVGMWWIFLPIGLVQFAGLFPVVLGIAAINIRVERKYEEKDHE